MKARQKPRPCTAAFITLGCKANKYDTSVIMAKVPPREFQVLETASPLALHEPADVYVINTCAVTEKSAFQSRQMIRRARRQNPAARIIATGCLAQIDPGSLVKSGADQVAGITERESVVRSLQGKPGPSGNLFFHQQAGMQARGRAIVKVQDGCDSRCAYCVVSIARGPGRSLGPDQVLSQLCSLAGRGFSEAVLVGINLGSYGRDLGASLEGLLQKIISAKGMPQRIRLSSIEPQELTSGIIDMMTRSKMICPHLHLPLQSGDPEVLQRMGRPYSPDHVEQMILSAARAVPNIGIGLDLIAGFPGETEAAHKNTTELVAKLPVSYLHVFPFSERPGTAAEKMKGKVPRREIKTRARELRELGHAKAMEFKKTQLGRELEAVAETHDKGFINGTSENYLRLKFKAGEDRIGSVVRVRACELKGNRLLAEAVD